jgi:2-polyprenyl-3-methyl-5-hydroxy-6-metoxy-1,4-benzoquinol methylase
MDLIENLDGLPLEHWYYDHKFKSILRVLERYIASSKLLVDVGAGSALFSSELARIYDSLKVVAVDTGYLDEHLGLRSNQVIYQRNTNGVSGDVYLLTDVLEHIEDDSTFLKLYSDESQKGAIFIITVPAMNILWSGHDVFLKHFRRYNKTEIRKIVESNGLEIISIQYLCSTLFPIVLMKRIFKKQKTSDLKTYSKFLNKMASLFLKPDYLISKRMNFGISLLAVAKKC